MTIVRPSWIYGPRDRNSLPRLMTAFRAGRVRLIGRGDNLLNVLYAADVAEGAIRAANHPQAGGRAYNLCGEGELTQRQFVVALTVFSIIPSTSCAGLVRVQRRLCLRADRPDDLPAAAAAHHALCGGPSRPADALQYRSGA